MMEDNTHIDELFDKKVAPILYQKRSKKIQEDAKAFEKNTDTHHTSEAKTAIVKLLSIHFTNNWQKSYT